MDLCQEKEPPMPCVALRMLIEKYREGQKELHCCVCGPRESLRQGSAGRTVVLYQKIRNSGKVCATCTGYVRGKQNSGEVCSRNYRKFQGQGWTAPGISVKSIPVCSDNGQ